MSPTLAVVVPTVGRPSLRALLASLATSEGQLPARVLLVDDRGDRRRPLLADPPPERLAAIVEVLEGWGRGPAAARNIGWRAAGTEWVAFVDDDVVVGPRWLRDLTADLHVGDDVAASQGRVTVPLPTDRRPTDWERNVAGLASARWATADMAYRRAALVAVGGFDERFPRAYREDADLGLRVVGRGWRIVGGRRRVTHPVRLADRWVSVRAQAGNTDDALMRARYGRSWRQHAGTPPGRRGRHLLTTAAVVGSAVAWLTGHRTAATGLMACWAALTTTFARERIAPGPRTTHEVTTMLATSVAIPPAAAWHWLRGWGTVVRRGSVPPDIAAVLLDRDGTLVVDVPYNGDPERVALQPNARAAIDILRSAGVPTAVISNQSGIARGRLSPAQVAAVNARVVALLGPIGPWLWCPHGPDDDCPCRKPRPGLVRRAAETLGVDVRRCVVIGDIGSDMAAARAAGARGVLVPTAVTLTDEITAAALVATDLVAAVEMALAGAPVTPLAGSSPSAPNASGRVQAAGEPVKDVATGRPA